MTKKNQEPKNLHKATVKVQVIIEHVDGNTYPHRKFLKKIGCSWNSDEKSWERKTTFSIIEMRQLIDLGLIVQRKIFVKPMELTITPILALTKENLHPEACVGYVKDLESPRSFEKKDVTKGYYQHFILIDESGYISCVAWDLVGINELKEDQLVVVHNVSLRKQKNEFELHCSSKTEILTVVKSSYPHSEEKVEERYKEWIMKDLQPIKEVKKGANQKLQGMITEVLGIYDYELEGKIHLMIHLTLDDHTEVIKTSLFGDTCSKLLQLTEKEKNEIATISTLKRIDSSLLADKINKLIGQEIIVRGTVELNQYTKLLELKGNKFYYKVE